MYVGVPDVLQTRFFQRYASRAQKGVILILGITPLICFLQSGYDPLSNSTQIGLYALRPPHSQQRTALRLCPFHPPTLLQDEGGDHTLFAAQKKKTKKYYVVFLRGGVRSTCFFTST